jgi:hypothetical protein
LRGVTNSRFDDRLIEATYEDDALTGVFVDDPDGGVWIPEALFDRLVQIGKAYSLHVLPMLGGSERIPLNRLAAESLLDELAFVAERVNDDLFVRHIGDTERFVAETLRRPGEVTVFVEGN